LVCLSTWRRTQIAPTILKLLGLNPHQLKAVQIEHTKALPLDDVNNDNNQNN